MGVPVRVALDALGGDHGPGTLVKAASRALLGDPDLHVALVGPAQTLAPLVRDVGDLAGDPRLTMVEAAEGVPMSADPVAAVRARRDTSVRVAAELVKRGAADATVSAGQTAAALAAATFVLGRLRGVTRPALAVLIPALAGPVVLLDAGAGTGLSADVLAQHALAGASYAEALGVTAPRVGLLTVGEEPGKGDDARRQAHRILEALPINYVGPVEGHDLALGGRADVVVADGFTGNVALKAMEGAVAWSAARLGERYGDPDPARALVSDTAHSSFAGGVLVGVKGVSVVAHGGASSRAVAAAVGLAAMVVRQGLVPRVAESLERLVALRRAGLGGSA